MHPAVTETAEKIRSLEIQGAQNIAERALAAIYTMLSDSEEADKDKLVDEIKEAVKILAATRPTEPALREALTYVLRLVRENDDLPGGVFKEAVMRGIERYVQELEKIDKKIAEFGSRLIPEGATVVTHCHSSTLMGVFREAAKEKEFSVIVTETRPRLQGLKTARELLEMGVKVTYIVDSAAYFFMREADLYMTGADVITADGKVINKIGTALIALAAQKFSVPYYVVASTLKFDPVTVLGVREPIEERDPAEVIDPSKLPGASIRNPAFDATPPSLVTAIVSELGVHTVYSFLGILSSSKKVDPLLEEVISQAFKRSVLHGSTGEPSP